MVDLIRINLNKGESHASRIERIRNRTRWAVLGGILLLLLAVNIGILLQANAMSNLIDDRREKIAEVETQLQKLKQEGMNLSKDDIQSLARLEDRRVFWAAKLRALAKNVAQDMALTEIEYRHNRFIISGITRIYPGEREFDIVNNFTLQLQQDPVFSNQFGRVKLLSYSRDNVRSQDIVVFQVEAELHSMGKVSSPRTTREPIIVGGNS